MPIATKGPFNRVFTRRDPNGFSIDAKPTIGTLAISGILVLEVEVEWGSALVCLDLRPQNSATQRAILHDFEAISSDVSLYQRMVHSQRQPVRALVCKDPPHETERHKEIVFQVQSISWEKTIGVYNDTERQVW